MSLSSDVITFTNLVIGRRAIFNIYVNNSSTGGPEVMSHTGFTTVDSVNPTTSSEGVGCATYVGDVTDTTVTFTMSVNPSGTYNVSAYQA